MWHRMLWIWWSYIRSRGYPCGSEKRDMVSYMHIATGMECLKQWFDRWLLWGISLEMLFLRSLFCGRDVDQYGAEDCGLSPLQHGHGYGYPCVEGRISERGWKFGRVMETEKSGQWKGCAGIATGQKTFWPWYHGIRISKIAAEPIDWIADDSYSPSIILLWQYGWW